METNRESLGRCLLIDIGAGTMDILWHDDSDGSQFKAVVASPVRTIAGQISARAGNLAVSGGEMGGGPVSRALIGRAAEADVAMTASAAATIHHNSDRVRSLGIRIVDPVELESLMGRPDYETLVIGDIEVDRLKRLVLAFGVPWEFDWVGICAQDHGVPPNGVSHLDYRHQLFQKQLETDCRPDVLLYSGDEVSPTFNRLSSIVKTARRLPTREIVVMDSGMAAILGSSLDPTAMKYNRVLVLDVATSHTVGAALENGKLTGFFEYHTQDVTPELLGRLLRQLAAGSLSHQKVLEGGGHGAWVKKDLGISVDETVVIATGPRRALLEGCDLPIVWGAPLGDNMMTGTAGLLEAIRRRRHRAAVDA